MTVLVATVVVVACAAVGDGWADESPEPPPCRDLDWKNWRDIVRWKGHDWKWKGHPHNKWELMVYFDSPSETESPSPQTRQAFPATGVFANWAQPHLASSSCAQGQPLEDDLGRISLGKPFQERSLSLSLCVCVCVSLSL